MVKKAAFLFHIASRACQCGVETGGLQLRLGHGPGDSRAERQEARQLDAGPQRRCTPVIKARPASDTGKAIVDSIGHRVMQSAMGAEPR